MAKKSDPNNMSFEEAYQELEALVTQLEEGDLPLEESMETFARGQALAKRCSQLLEQAELKLTALTSEEGDGYTEDDVDYELEE